MKTRKTVRSDHQSISYGPWKDDRWLLGVTTTDRDRIELVLEEPAMYELWTEVRDVPWPSESDPVATVKREIVEIVRDMTEDESRALLDDIQEDLLQP